MDTRHPLALRSPLVQRINELKLVNEYIDIVKVPGLGKLTVPIQQMN